MKPITEKQLQEAWEKFKQRDDERYHIAKFGPFKMDVINDGRIGPLPKVYEITNRQGGFVLRGLQPSVQQAFDNLQLLYAEWLMVKPELPLSRALYLDMESMDDKIRNVLQGKSKP